jgi:hypothetical protein
MACEIVNLVDVFEHEVPDFPGQRNELFFSLSMEKMQPVVVFPCYLCNKHLVRDVTWKERRIFLGAKDHYYTVIFLSFKCPLPVKKLGCLAKHPGSILS